MLYVSPRQSILVNCIGRTTSCYLFENWKVRQLSTNLTLLTLLHQKMRNCSHIQGHILACLDKHFRVTIKYRLARHQLSIMSGQLKTFPWQVRFSPWPCDDLVYDLVTLFYLPRLPIHASKTSFIYASQKLYQQHYSANRLETRTSSHV